MNIYLSDASGQPALGQTKLSALMAGSWSVLRSLPSAGLLAIALTACGGGGSDVANTTSDGGVQEPKPPVTLSSLAAPTNLAMSVANKKMTLSWSAVPNATSYKVFEIQDGVLNQVPVASTSTTSFTKVFPLYELAGEIEKKYTVQACSANGCGDTLPSQNLASKLAPDTIRNAIQSVVDDNADEADHFARGALAISQDGKTLVVGAPDEDGVEQQINDLDSGKKNGGPNLSHGPNGMDTNVGAVYVFIHNGTTWQKNAYLKPKNRNQGEQFGAAVAVSGDGKTVLVGAIGHDGISNNIQKDRDTAGANDQPNDFDVGAAYVFVKDSNGKWDQDIFLKGSNSTKGDRFGYSLALSKDGKTAAVGASDNSSNTGVHNGKAPGVNHSGATDSGAVYIFAVDTGATAKTWTQQAFIKASNPQQSDFFGASIALSGDGNELAVGAIGEDSVSSTNPKDNTASNAGAVYTYSRNPSSNWYATNYLKPTKSKAGDKFGTAVALSDDGKMLLVGAPGETLQSANGTVLANAGAAYLFSCQGKCNQVWRLEAFSPAANDNFASSVSMSADGGLVAMAAWGENSSALGIGGDSTSKVAGQISGATYVFKRSNSGWDNLAYVKPKTGDAKTTSQMKAVLAGDGSTLAVSHMTSKGGVFLY